MIRRVAYYWQRIRTLRRQHGTRHLTRVLWASLCRHWFFTRFAWHWLEFYLFAPHRSALRTVRRAVLGEVPVPSDDHAPIHLLFYASFDRASAVGEHVSAQLRAHHEAGFHIVFVTTSTEFDAQAEAAVRPYCMAAIHRKNIGIDFGSWKAGYEWLKGTPGGPACLHRANTVLLANDSCYGPFHSMLPSWTQMRNAPNAVYGITRSLEIRPYLQSYYLHFGTEVVARGLFREFMTRHVRLLATKDAVARFLEVGGSAFLERRGVPLMALIDAAEEPARGILKKHQLLDPIRDPAGREFLEMGLTPFHKRSNTLHDPSRAR